MTSLPAKIFVAGHRGLVGSAIVRALQRRVSAGEPWEILTRSRSELNLLDEPAVRAFFQTERPTHVVLAAAKVGGIKANDTFPVQFMLENLKIQNHVIENAHAAGTERLLFLGSSCIYPKFAPQPICEDAFLTGPLEPTNDAYALAKIAGVKLCQSYRKQYGARFIAAMPTNLYGPHDNFDLENSHVLPGLIHRFHNAKENGDPSVTVWGSGSPRREFLHADDLAEACLVLLDRYDSEEIINVGVGEDVTIRELAEMVKDAVGFPGELAWDATKPDGTPRKLLDVSRIHALGWHAQVPLRDGIRRAYEWFQANWKKAKPAAV